MGNRYQCSGCGADLSGSPSSLTTCPSCGALLDTSAMKQAEFELMLKIVGGLALLFGGAAGLWGQRLFFPDAQTIIPGLLIGLAVATLTVAGIIFAASGQNRVSNLLGFFFGLAVLAAIGGAVWLMVWGLSFLLSPFWSWVLAIIVGLPLLLGLLAYLASWLSSGK